MTYDPKIPINDPSAARRWLELLANYLTKLPEPINFDISIKVSKGVLVVALLALLIWQWSF